MCVINFPSKIWLFGPRRVLPHLNWFFYTVHTFYTFHLHLQAHQCARHGDRPTDTVRGTCKMFTNRPHGTDVKRFKGLTPEIQFWQPIHTWIYREGKTKPRPSTRQNLPFSSALVSHNLRMHSEINRDVDFGLGFKIRFWSRSYSRDSGLV